MLDDLTDQESALVDAARDGRILRCDNDQRIRAELVRELLLGRRGELDPRGVRLHGARVVGALELDYVTASVGLDLTDCDIEEPVDLAQAALPRLVLIRSRLAGLHAVGVRISGDLLLNNAVVAGTGEGAIRLRAAHIGGALSMDGVAAHDDSGPALHANRIRVDGIFLLRRARMAGHSDRGTVRVAGAHIGGELNAQGIDIRNDAGPALDAANLTVDSNTFFDDVTVSGRGNKGALRLSGVRVGGLLTLHRVDISNPSGPALRADGAHVGGELLIRDGQMSGAGSVGAICLRSARVGYDLHLVDTEVHNESGPGVFAPQVRVQDNMLLQPTRISGSGYLSEELINVREAQVGAGVRFPALVICPGPHACDRRLVDINDFAYGSLDGIDWRQWLHFIRRHTSGYRPSPYQQLAAVERAAGHDGNARNVLIAQQHDLRHRMPWAIGGRLTRWFHWLWGALAGYGYRARRTALALLVALVVAGAVSLWAGHVTTGPGRHAAEHTVASGVPRTPCSTVELVGLGLDRGLPLGPTGLRTRCDLDTETTAGQVFTVLLWIVQAAVWGLATLALAGYTGLIRKSA